MLFPRVENFLCYSFTHRPESFYSWLSGGLTLKYGFRKMQKENKWKKYYKEKYPEIWKKRVIHYGFTEYHKCILALLDAREGEQILECGIGTGAPLAISLANKGIQMTGVDISQDLLELCRKNFHKERLSVKCYEI